MSKPQSNPQPVEICFLFPLVWQIDRSVEEKEEANHYLSVTSHHYRTINAPFLLLFFFLFPLPGLVEAWMSPQAEFGLLPAIRSL